MRKQIKPDERVSSQVTECRNGYLHTFTAIPLNDGRQIILCSICGQVSTIVPLMPPMPTMPPAKFQINPNQLNQYAINGFQMPKITYNVGLDTSQQMATTFNSNGN